MITNESRKELPMNCMMGRSSVHHAIYVKCWVEIWKLLKEADNKRFKNNDNK